MPKIQRALLSVSDKTGILPLAQILANCGVELISTGGTAQFLRSNGIRVVELSEFTGFPEMLDGRVKTLHPKVHGGLLFVRGNPLHEAAIEKQEIRAIDLVVVNLYPFESTVAKVGVSIREAIENIDIGGPSMLRSAAKNHESVTVVIHPEDYAEVADQIQATGGTSLELRQRLAARVFARTASYDDAIAAYLKKAFGPQGGERATATAGDLPPSLRVEAPKTQSLRYGENPHQLGALYGNFGNYFKQLQGKELSYNNILDLTAATRLMTDFASDRPTVAILKHTNPCGVGQADSALAAYEKALATDRQAAFGGILVVNRELDLACAERMTELFSEVIVAPGFEPEALHYLAKKKNLRLIQLVKGFHQAETWDVRSLGFESFLMQSADICEGGPGDGNVVTKRKPSAEEWQAMQFGWRVVKHVKSNAIVYVAADGTLGIGAGQMSRVDASRIAVWKAAEAGLSLKGSAVCSDAFFPFADGLEAAAGAGATACIQPGGSLRDDEVIEAANKHGMAMVFTGRRHFRH
jgi:phosphoribosylaminoimidazolecarboxamide formyltransferase/IMP cyclohydrolase